MAQLFKKLQLMFLRLMGVQPYSVALNYEKIDEEMHKSALLIHYHYKDESIVAVLKCLKSEETRCLYNLAAFAGSKETLCKLQGRLESIQSFMRFIVQAGEMRPEEVKVLKQNRVKETKSRVLNFGSSRGHKETVI